jgi:hypothetical protein
VVRVHAHHKAVGHCSTATATASNSCTGCWSCGVGCPLLLLLLLLWIASGRVITSCLLWGRLLAVAIKAWPFLTRWGPAGCACASNAARAEDTQSRQLSACVLEGGRMHTASLNARSSCRGIQCSMRACTLTWAGLHCCVAAQRAWTVAKRTPQCDQRSSPNTGALLVLLVCACDGGGTFHNIEKCAVRVTRVSASGGCRRLPANRCGCQSPVCCLVNACSPLHTCSKVAPGPAPCVHRLFTSRRPAVATTYVACHASSCGPSNNLLHLKVPTLPARPAGHRHTAQAPAKRSRLSTCHTLSLRLQLRLQLRRGLLPVVSRGLRPSMSIRRSAASR